MSSKKDGSNKPSSRTAVTTHFKPTEGSKQKKTERKNGVSRDNTVNGISNSDKEKNRILKSVVQVEKDQNVSKPKEKNVIKSRTTGSGRISTDIFFPSKTMYKNALETKNASKKNVAVKVMKGIPGNIISPDSPSTSRNNTERKPTVRKKQVDSPSTGSKRTGTDKIILKNRVSNIKNIKTHSMVKKEESSDTSEISERPRTATLRKGSIVNTNIVGPNIPLKDRVKLSPKSDETDFNYEDDFESYESDFDEYSSSPTPKIDDISDEETSSVSSEEECDKLEPILPQTELTSEVTSSNTYEERLDSGNYDMPENINKLPIHLKKYLVNVNLKEPEISKNNPASLSDEGFEDQKSLQFINFLDAKKRYEAEEKACIRRKRGEHILSMIRLDKVSFTILSLPPVPYDIFIKTYGKRNTIQTATQTGEDNVDEEIQTDTVEMATKWTQHPTAFSIEKMPTNFHDENSGICDQYSLNKFILATGNLIIKIQEESLCSKNSKKLKNTPITEEFFSRILEDIDEVTI